MKRMQHGSAVAAPPATSWSRCEERIEAFERAWRIGPTPSGSWSPPNIGDFLCGEGLAHEKLLAELIHADLEFRLKAGEAARVEAYLGRFARLHRNRAAVLGLLLAEYELRQRTESGVCVDEYARRFPAYAEELWQRLARAATHAGTRAKPHLTASGRELPVVSGYEILGEIGHGGMGIVYRARQLGLDRIVALKMVLTGFEASAKDLARFRAEAAALARLQHPNIVQIFDVGETGGRPYFVFEFVAGGSLAQQLDGTPQPVRPSAQLALTLARAVHAAHASGVIHRDLKPANILMMASGLAGGEWSSPTDDASILSTHLAKITDFGLAKCIVGDEPGADQRGPTVTGELLGTPNYMAPEQAMVRRQPVGPTTDVYALGAILYELLTGRPPFTARRR